MCVVESVCLPSSLDSWNNIAVLFGLAATYKLIACLILRQRYKN